MKFLLEERNFFETYGLMIAIAVILIVMIVVSYVRNKKLRDDASTLINGLKVGDDVKTYSGLCGKIVAFSEVDGVKTALIECDKLGYKGVFEIDANAIYAKTGIVAEEVKPETEEVEDVKIEEPALDKEADNKEE